MKILLAILNQGQIRAELAQALLSLKSKHEVEIYFSNLRPISSNRNHIANKFISWDYDYLIMCDEDIAIQPDFIDKFVENDKDVCSWYIWTTWDNWPYPLALDKEIDWTGYQIKKELTLWLNEVDATGTWLICIRRNVIEKMSKPYFQFVFDEEWGLIKWEDFNFCDKAKELWFEVFIDTSIKTKHFKTNSIN